MRRRVQQAGFELSDFKQGWALLLEACATTAFEDQPAADTPKTTELDGWKTKMFVRTTVALRRAFPKQYAFVLGSLPMRELSAPVAVRLFLEGCEALAKSAKRKSTRKEDHAALAAMARRGVTQEELATARKLLAAAQLDLTAEKPEPQPVIDARARATRELYAWVQDWTEAARAVVPRRDQRLRLGIGKRRPRSKKEPTGDPHQK